MQELRDSKLKVTQNLPNGAATTTSAAIDTGKSSKLGQQTGGDFLLTVPGLTTGQQPDGKTIKYDICWSDKADLSSPTTYIAAALTQTGASGNGAAANTFRCRLPSNGGRFVFFKATGSASGDSSSQQATFELLL